MVFKDILNIPRYQISYQLSERRTSIPVKLRLPSAEKPKINRLQPLRENCLYQFTLTVSVINFHQIQERFGTQLQIRNEAEAPSVREDAAMDQGFWTGREAPQGSRTGPFPAASLLLV